MFDYLIVGAGFAGSVLAERLANGSNKKVLICDKRPHIGGNSWGMMLALAYGGTYPDHIRAIVTISSGPVTSEYLAVFSENLRSRLCPSDMETVQYWSEPPRRAADFERAGIFTITHWPRR